jgi:hypothetical protein
VSPPCPTCGARHGPPPHRFAVPLPDALAALDAAALERRAVLGTDNAALDDAAWFLRGALTLPRVGAGAAPAITYLAWCAVDRSTYKRSKALARSDRREREAPIAARLANALPGHPASLGLEVALEPRPPGEPLAIIVPPPRRGDATSGDDHVASLADEQARGIDPHRVAILVAAVLHP